MTAQMTTFTLMMIFNSLSRPIIIAPLFFVLFYMIYFHFLETLKLVIEMAL